MSPCPARARVCRLRGLPARASGRASRRSAPRTSGPREPTAGCRSSHYPQKPGIGASADKALRIFRGYEIARERVPAACLGLHELLERAFARNATRFTHFLQDLFPGSFDRMVFVDGDAVLVRLRRLLFGEVVEQSAEQFELPARLALGRFCRFGLDLREHLVDVV